MKNLLAIFGGFTVSLGMFVGGLAVATYFLAVDPVAEPARAGDVAEIWTIEPRRVDTASQDYERIGDPVAAPDEVMMAMASTGTLTDANSPSLDGGRADGSYEVASLSGDVELEQSEPTALPAAHVAWCANRYRSYREETNTYRPYSGGEQTCVSPYAEEQVGGRSGEAAVQSASVSGMASGLSASHIRDCQSRYRSYRVSDNSYQPYGGGPRRQC
ncbi:hypothetical protein GCM10007908_18710 [Rhizobium albus]|nr:hypothetical protein GCM10007908_18710 [Rhizobium albus]